MLKKTLIAIVYMILVPGYVCTVYPFVKSKESKESDNDIHI